MRSLAVCLASLLPIVAQDWTTQITALRPAPAEADQLFLHALEERSRQSLASIHHAETPAEATQARPGLRRRLEHALGLGQMPWPPALKARVTGTVPRKGYRIEKVAFQSLPGMDVSALLYIPDRLQAPAPAVLFYNGHWYPDSKTKDDFQAFNITMARHGFVVFSFDPFGQGERGISIRDHRRVSSLLVGVAQQGFAEYETRCALEYLLSRPEVDPSRVGMTGASGGGYNTWITSALDDRIKVAVPVVGTSDFYDQIHYARSVDWYHAAEHCHFVPGLVTFADNRELLAMAAPRPILIINSATDPGFPIGGVFDYGRRLYTAYDAPDKIALFLDATAGHGYQQKKREAAYGWFLKWLMGRGDGSPVPEEPVDSLPWNAPELRVFQDGQKRAAGPSMEAFAREIASRIPERKATDPAEFFGIAAPRRAALTPIANQPVQRLEFRIQDNVKVPAFLARPPNQRGILLAIDDRGKEALAQDPLVRRAFEKGWSVCGIDPRGIGELSTEAKGWTAAVSLLASDHFIWRQAGDLLAAAAALESRETPLALYARGDNATLAATYALAHSHGFRWYALRNGFLSYRQFLDRPASLPASYRLMDEDRREERFTAFDHEIPFWYVPFDVLHAFDLPQLLRRSNARGFILNPIDGDWREMTPAAARKLLPPSVRVLTRDSELWGSL